MWVVHGARLVGGRPPYVHVREAPSLRAALDGFEATPGLAAKGGFVARDVVVGLDEQGDVVAHVEVVPLERFLAATREADASRS